MTEINLTCAINNLGYGMHGLGYYKALKKRGFDIKLRPVNKEITEEQIRKIAIDLYIDPDEFVNDVNRSEIDAPNFIVWHADHYQNVRMNGKNVLFAAFETDKLQKGEELGFKQADKAGTYSSWGCSVMYEYGIDSLLMPGPIMPAYLPKDHKCQIPEGFTGVWDKNKPTLFCPGKWEIRKGHPVLVRHLTDLALEGHGFNALCFWNNIFTGGLTQPTEELKRFAWNLHRVYDWKTTKIFHYKINNSDLYLFDYVESYRDLLNFMWISNIAVSYSSGEGWDLPMAEMTYLAKTTVISFNTAHLDYVYKSPYAISCNRHLANDGLFFKGDRGHWYPVVEDIAINQLQIAIKNWQDQDNIVKSGDSADEIAIHSGINNIAQSFESIILNL